MNLSKILMTLLLCAVSFLAGYFLRGIKKYEQVHRLEKPLRITTDDPKANYVLPPGTVLYLDAQPPEGGFDQYRIYINVFGKPLETVPTARKGEIAPLTAFEED